MTNIAILLLQSDVKPLLKTVDSERVSVQDNLKRITVIVQALTQLSQVGSTRLVYCQL